MIDLHIVVLLITIAHGNIYIDKVVFWLSGLSLTF